MNDQNKVPLSVKIMEPRSGFEAVAASAKALTAGFSEARHIAWRFFLRDTQAAHRGSFLGYSWLFIAPIVNTFIWVFLNGQSIIKIETATIPYPVFVLTGNIIWTAFTSALTTMMGIISSGVSTLGKVNFAHEALIYSGLMKVLVDSAAPALLLVPTLFWYHVSFSWGVIVFPLVLGVAVLFGAAIGCLINPITALISDLNKFVQMGLRLAFFITPVVFSIPAQGFGRQVMLLNPMTPVIESGRSWLTGSTGGMPWGFAVVSIVSVGLFVFGLVLFKFTLPRLIERIGGQ